MSGLLVSFLSVFPWNDALNSFPGELVLFCLLGVEGDRDFA